MSTWFTADPHFGHPAILAFRPGWATVEVMDADLVERWNAVVRPTDTVYVLGDVAVSTAGLGPVDQLAGRKILICGNHDAPWAGHPRRGDARPYREAGFAEIHPHLHHTTVAGRRVRLAHLPYSTHQIGAPFPAWKPTDDGVPLLHGHVHEERRASTSPAGTPEVNVGVDVWDFAPVSAEELAELLPTP